MHIMINNNYLSLDNIMTISTIRYDETDKPSFSIVYHSGKESSFYYTPEAKQDEGELWYDAFYFKNRGTFERCHKQIIQILTNAAKFNQTNQSL
jgi:hypothetical protein